MTGCVTVLTRFSFRIALLLPAMATVAVIAGCEPRITVHGYAPNAVELAELEPGIDTVFSLEERVGRPAAAGLLEDNTWYYVQTTVEHLTYHQPKVTDRTIVAVTFDDDGVVASVDRYGLQDGRVINLNTRVTESDVKKVGILASLFGNIGGLTADQLLGDN